MLAKITTTVCKQKSLQIFESLRFHKTPLADRYLVGG